MSFLRFNSQITKNNTNDDHKFEKLLNPNDFFSDFTIKQLHLSQDSTSSKDLENLNHIQEIYARDFDNCSEETTDTSQSRKISSKKRLISYQIKQFMQKKLQTDLQKRLRIVG